MILNLDKLTEQIMTFGTIDKNHQSTPTNIVVAVDQKILKYSILVLSRLLSRWPDQMSRADEHRLAHRLEPRLISLDKKL